MSKFKFPKDWNNLKLQDIAIVQTGIAKNSKKILDSITLPYLRVANVQDGHLDLSEVKYVDVAKDKVDRYLLQEGDVLLTEGGDFDKLGRGTIWKNEIPKCVHQNHVFVVRVDQKRLLPYFLECVSSSYIGRTYFLSCSKQTTNLASINSTQLKQMPLTIPPLVEQEKIAEILGCWDIGIERLEKLIAAKQKMKKALMQQLLTGKKRFKEFEGQEWKTLKLIEIGVFSKGAGVSKSEVVAEGKPAVRYGELYTTHDIIIKTIQTFINDESSQLSKQINSGDILFAGSGETADEIGKSAAYLGEELAYAGGDIIIFSPDDNDSTYLAYVLNSEYVRKELRKLGQGNSVVHIYKYNLENLEVLLPSIKEQQKIASVLNAADKEIEILRKKLDELKNQKKGLMQKLLTGKIRVEI